MARTPRLLELMQELRSHRRPVSAATLAEALGVSVRTIYRDVLTLAAQGAPIVGEAGVGYVLRPGFFLPPLMLSDDEAEAVVLGLRWVAQRGDAELAGAAKNAAAKIIAVMPEDLRGIVDDASVFAVPTPDAPTKVDLAVLRGAIRRERKLRIAYLDGQGRVTNRTVWPLGLTLFDGSRLTPAWCELRGDFRVFRVDRIGEAEETGEGFPRRRRALLKEFRARENLPDPNGPI
jgi:predicted DNA-binding transcriptional regulator YafY